MPISDLTGYTWVGNSTIDNSTGMYSINFTSNGNQYTSIYTDYRYDYDDDIVDYDFLMYDAYYVYSDGIWDNEAYKTIEITGGSDVTNSNLIQWLQDNGTLTAPTPSIDLTNTIWKIKTNADASTIPNASINFTSNNQNFTSINNVYSLSGIVQFYSLQNTVNAYESGSWVSNYRTIQITGGTDLSSSSLISWLQTNADQYNDLLQDLTGCNREIESPLGAVLSQGVYALNFKSGGVLYNQITVDLSNQIIYQNTSTNASLIAYSNGSWESTQARRVFISGGTDKTNQTLLDWFGQYSTEINVFSYGESPISQLFAGQSGIKKIIYNDIVLYYNSAVDGPPDNAILTSDNTYLVDTTGGYILTTE